MAYLASPLQGSGANAPQATNSALALTVERPDIQGLAYTGVILPNYVLGAASATTLASASTS